MISKAHNLPPPIEPIDALMAIVVKMCRISYRNDFNPLRLTLQRKKPICAEEFTRYFRAPIEFSAVENSIYFDKQSFYTSLPTANAELTLANDHVITEYLAHLDRSDIIMQVKAKLIELLSSGEVSEETIAVAIHISHRTMQRKHREAGTTYMALLDETRRELASQYVQNSRLSLNEITFLLGFSALSNFSRAFKRWTGVPPSAYRMSILHPPGAPG